MSKAVGSARSGYETGSAAKGAGQAAAGRASAGSAQSNQPGSRSADASRPGPRPADTDNSVAAEPAAEFSAGPGPVGDDPLGAGSADEYPPGSGPADDYLPPARPASAAEPSWPQVIATTLRLWLHRRVLRDSGPDGAPRTRSRRRASVFGLVIIVFAAGALTIALAQNRTTSGTPGRAAAKSGHPVTLGPAGLAVAAANREQAAAWVAAEVSHSGVVSCDPVMCAALLAHGFPAGDLLALNASANDPMGSDIVVSTTDLRNQFGSRLPNVYAPLVIASFGTGTARVDIRIEAPAGSRDYLAAERADLSERLASGQQLLGNKFVHVSGTLRQDIATGRVDSRLLITLAALTHQQDQVYIEGFGDIGPGAAGGVPLRMMRIAALLSGHGGTSQAYSRSVLKFLGQQVAPYRASLSVVTLPGQTDIQIQFAAPTPLGLLGAHPSP
jgi:hypothetical protein